MKSVWFYRSAKMNEHMKLKYSLLALAAPLLMNAQQVMTPEILWTLKKSGSTGSFTRSGIPYL